MIIIRASGTATIIVVALVVLAIVLVPISYLNRVYRLDRAIGDLDSASRAGDVERLVSYYKDARDKLAIYYGNPVWIFGTSRTNIDNMKEDIDGVILRAERGNVTEHELDEMKDTAWRLSEQLGRVGWWVWLTPVNTILAILWCIAIFIASLVAMD